MKADRHCPCGKPIVQKKNERYDNFKVRRYCDKRCRNIHCVRGPKPDPVKFCEFCEEQLIRREGEAPYRFAARNTCDQSCAAKLRYKKKPIQKPDLPFHFDHGGEQVAIPEASPPLLANPMTNPYWRGARWVFGGAA